MNKEKTRKGFTVIEVSLVFAVAGLIFLAVFVALPAIQRTQRDAKRREDVGTLLTAIQKYQSNNRGTLPGDSDALKGFLDNSFKDPAGEAYKLEIVYCGSNGTGKECSNGKVASETFESNNYKMYIIKSATCNGSTAVGSGNGRKVAVVYKLEGGGAYCGNI